MENHGKFWQNMEKFGKPWKTMEKFGKTWKNAAMALFGVSPFQKTPINVKSKSQTMKSFDLIQQEMKKLEERIKELENQMDEQANTNLSWLDSDDVCKMLHISKRTLKKYCDEGLFPFSKLRTRNYYRKTDINKYLNNHLTTKTNKP